MNLNYTDWLGSLPRNPDGTLKFTTTADYYCGPPNAEGRRRVLRQCGRCRRVPARDPHIAVCRPCWLESIPSTWVIDEASPLIATDGSRVNGSGAWSHESMARLRALQQAGIAPARAGSGEYRVPLHAEREVEAAIFRLACDGAPPPPPR